jgi:filamentous hemagglutinin family protein
MAGGAQSQAQHITVDGRLSPAQTLPGPNYAIGANLGRQVRGNLFHSFGAFGLTPGETATFSGPGTVRNVIGRVTGGTQSSIDGTIRSTIPSADVYLINPAGVVFGPHAAVDVSGSFHASSADYLRLADGARFQASNPDASTLTAAPPVAFGFLSGAAGPVSTSGTILGPVPGRLALVGGPVTISGGSLNAPGGTIHIASAAGPGEIPVDPRNGPAPTVTQHGAVTLAGTIVSASDPSGAANGSVHVHGGTVTIASSQIDADSISPAPPGTIALRGETSLGITQASNVHAFAAGAGRGADISISTSPVGGVLIDASYVTAATASSNSAGQIAITTPLFLMGDGAQLLDATIGPGPGGAINLSAVNMFLTDNNTVVASTTGSPVPVSNDIPFGTGGNINLLGSNLSLARGARIVAGSLNNGTVGDINISLSSAVALTSVGQDAAHATTIGTVASATGVGGKITLMADSVTLSDLSRIMTGSAESATPGGLSISARTIELNDSAAILSNGSLNLFGVGTTGAHSTSGSITVLASESLRLNGGSANSAGSRIDGTTTSDHTGGDVAVHAGNIEIHGTSLIESGTKGDGAAGRVTVTVDGGLLIDRPAYLAETAFKPGITSVSRSANPQGQSGNVTVSAHDITIHNGLINADTFEAAPAGTVKVSVADALTISGPPGGAGTFAAGITSQANRGSLPTAHGGSMVIDAGSIALSSNGSISSTSFGDGNAGNVSVTARGSIDITGAGQTHDIKITGIHSQADIGSRGNAGTVTVNAGSLSLVDAGAEIASQGLGTGAAGTVTVSLTGNLLVDGRDSTSITTGILARTENVAAGPAGRVTVSAANGTIQDGGEISSSSNGTGAAGGVEITIPGTLTIRAADGPAGLRAGIFSNSNLATSEGGAAGAVIVHGGNLLIGAGGSIATQTFGGGTGGNVMLTVGGTATIDGAGSGRPTGVLADAENSASGPAGQIDFRSGMLILERGGQVASTTAGTGTGGAVNVTVPGAVVLDGRGGRGTQIAASATGARSGNAGTVTVTAGSITVQGGAQIASTTAGTGQGGNVTLAANDITLSGLGQQIATGSTGTGNAGSITLAATRLSLSDGADVSTQANTANGGNIRITVQDMLRLQHSGITTQVNGALGSGGNILIDPRFVILDSSVIRANAIGGNGGNITIVADQLVRSSDSAITATSQLGLSGEIAISGPQLDLNSSLVVLASALRSAAAVLHESCAARGDRPNSSLVVAGKGGLRQEAQSRLPALYIANRPIGDESKPDGAAVPAVPVALTLSAPCA